jgi:hypothetical protein
MVTATELQKWTDCTSPYGLSISFTHASFLLRQGTTLPVQGSACLFQIGEVLDLDLGQGYRQLRQYRDYTTDWTNQNSWFDSQ